MQYLDLLWLPRPFTPGLFNDQIKASLSLWSPVTTLPCLLAVLGLIVGAWLLRGRWPALALAILFYFVGPVDRVQHDTAGAVFRTPQLPAGDADVLAAGAVAVRRAAGRAAGSKSVATEVAPTIKRSPCGSAAGRAADSKSIATEVAPTIKRSPCGSAAGRQWQQEHRD